MEEQKNTGDMPEVQAATPQKKELKDRKMISLIIAIVVLVVIGYFASTIQQDPYKGLTLTKEVQKDESTDHYIKNRIATEEASLAIDRASGEDPNLDMIEILAYDYNLDGDLVGAREAYEEYLEYHTINYAILANYASILTEMGDLEAAEQAYRDVIVVRKAEGYYRSLVDVMGESNEDGSRDEDIKEALEEGIETVGQTGYLLINLAQWYIEHDDCKRGIEHYEVANVVVPDDPGLQSDIAKARVECTD
jgi:tetratricopeptide (TPR) repeat protein